VTENEVPGRTVNQADNGGLPADPPALPSNRKALRTLALSEGQLGGGNKDGRATSHRRKNGSEHSRT
jgi:hypothetical protein